MRALSLAAAASAIAMAGPAAIDRWQVEPDADSLAVADVELEGPTTPAKRRSGAQRRKDGRTFTPSATGTDNMAGETKPGGNRRERRGKAAQHRSMMAAYHTALDHMARGILRAKQWATVREGIAAHRSDRALERAFKLIARDEAAGK